ncbi:hypothetical protein RFI_03275 [Reticulomyxa filosa]|uniref:Uncharacterized protein n=1 Tax=Reticulomyxa filosa TaxID=46433 RepID=X6P868_RETFI|nr:hypothetical protein RFI_03275 [Reticulomyxa filosa]|eukprot:ETO33827.1 hypothetical protein RFI_03275 [Reticulomyxa filosa]
MKKEEEENVESESNEANENKNVNNMNDWKLGRCASSLAMKINKRTRKFQKRAKKKEEDDENMNNKIRQGKRKQRWAKNYKNDNDNDNNYDSDDDNVFLHLIEKDIQCGLCVQMFAASITLSCVHSFFYLKFYPQKKLQIFYCYKMSNLHHKCVYYLLNTLISSFFYLLKTCSKYDVYVHIFMYLIGFGKKLKEMK